MDDNAEIISLIQARMDVGVKRYGHGVRSEDDTRQWGTEVDSWAEMALEEALDMTIYLCGELIRIRNARDGVFLPDRTPLPPIPTTKQKTARRGHVLGRLQRFFGWDK